MRGKVSSGKPDLCEYPQCSLSYPASDRGSAQGEHRYIKEKQWNHSNYPGEAQNHRSHIHLVLESKCSITYFSTKRLIKCNMKTERLF